MATLHLLSLLVSLILFAAVEDAGAARVGVNYGRDGNNLPSPSQVASLLASNTVQKVRIFDASSAVLTSFSGTAASFIVGVPNEQLQSLAASQDTANQMVSQTIAPYSTQIKYIAVGNEVFVNNAAYAQYLLPAMQNVHNALATSGLQSSITVSTTHSTGVLDSSSFPPSNGNFQSSIRDQMTSVLGFLAQTGSPFMASVYPFLAYINGGIDLQYALFGPSSTVVSDQGNGLRYTNLFDAQVDTLISAMEKLGYSGIPVLVCETGWPSQGDTAATVDNARTYNGNLVNHVAGGTPKRPGVAIEAYIFSLFNENLKSGAPYEPYWGLFNADGSKVYDITL